MTKTTYNSEEITSALTVKVNGTEVIASPREGESALRFFARVARDNGIRNFDIDTDSEWDEDAPATNLTGEFDIVKVDKPGM